MVISNWGLFQCDVAHHPSVVVLHMLYKMTCNPMHPLYGALPIGLHTLVTRGALYLSVPVEQTYPVFDGVGLAGFKSSQYLCFFIGLAARSLLSPPVLPLLSFVLWVGIVGLGLSIFLYYFSVFLSV